MSDPAFDIVAATNGNSALTAGGTLTFVYPDARALVSYAGQGPALMYVRTNQATYTQDVDFTLVYGLTNITVTYNGATPIAANAIASLQLPLRDTSGQPTVAGYSVPDSIQPAGF